MGVVMGYSHTSLAFLISCYSYRMLACMCFYGHCQNTARLGSSVLMSYLLGALVEIPSWCVPWLIHRLGRRLPLAVAFLISALAGFTYALVPEGGVGVYGY